MLKVTIIWRCYTKRAKKILSSSTLCVRISACFFTSIMLMLTHVYMTNVAQVVTPTILSKSSPILLFHSWSSKHVPTSPNKPLCQQQSVPKRYISMSAAFQEWIYILNLCISTWGNTLKVCKFNFTILVECSWDIVQYTFLFKQPSWPVCLYVCLCSICWLTYHRLKICSE